MKKWATWLLLLNTILLLNCNGDEGTAQPDPDLPDADLKIKVLTENLSHPWDLVWGPDNHIWLTERGGKVSRVDPETGVATVIATISDVKSTGEGGLLGMVLHPDFTNTPEVFLVFNYDKAGTYTEKVVKYTFNGSTLASPVVLLDNIAAASIHNGSRLIISPDLKLFISTGDAANQPLAQDVNSLSGKILRLNLDGTIPADNPINGNPVWSFGHRNAQGLVFANDKLYSSEHGPSKDDEINIIEKGRNHGWPIVNGFCDEPGEQSFCNDNQVVEPLISFTPTIAVSGMDYYNHAQIPQWKNSLLVATLKDQTLYQFKLNDADDEIIETNTFYKGEFGRVRDVLVAPDGKVYLATSNGSNDKIIEISRGN